ncbi:MAG TPA: HlyD family efflux transporter periplasmic adaptor subunit [Clostridia bacterium]|nr:HlyD family efflux transporter periplasmic adaptor subunit [Clostridia bacterium]
MKKFFIKKTAAIVCASLALMGTVGCSGNTVAVSEASAIRVHTQQPIRDNIVQTAEFTGRVMPDDSISVYGKASGTVLKTYFEVGDTVKEGQLLYELDPTDYQIALEQSKIAYELTLNNIGSAESGSGNAMTELQYQTNITNAQNAYETARAALELKVEDDFSMSDYKKARKKYKDAKDAWDQNANDETWSAYVAAEKAYNTELDQYGNRSLYNSYYVAFETAYDAYESALKAYDIYKGITSGENNTAYDLQRQQAKLAYDSAQQTLDNLKVYAPIGGVIEQKNVTNNGQYSPSGAGYVVSNKEVLVVNFSVAADIATAMSIGDEVTIESGRSTYKAVITEIGTMINSSSGLFPIKARLVDQISLLSGVSVKLIAQTAKSQSSIIIPLSAVYYDNGSAYVYLATDNVAIKAPVVIGIISGDNAEVLSGLDDTAQVITTWNPNMADGVAVEVNEEV